MKQTKIVFRNTYYSPQSKNGGRVGFFRKNDAFFSLHKKCAENYPEQEILKFVYLYLTSTYTALQCTNTQKFKIKSLG